jgi:hypothetical protein
MRSTCLTSSLPIKVGPDWLRKSRTILNPCSREKPISLEDLIILELLLEIDALDDHFGPQMEATGNSARSPKS